MQKRFGVKPMANTKVGRTSGLKKRQGPLPIASGRTRTAADTGRAIGSTAGDTRPTLEQRLSRFDPARHGGEVMGVKPKKAERW
jgi:antitoxin MazE